MKKIFSISASLLLAFLLLTLASPAYAGGGCGQNGAGWICQAGERLGRMIMSPVAKLANQLLGGSSGSYGGPAGAVAGNPLVLAGTAIGAGTSLGVSGVMAGVDVGGFVLENGLIIAGMDESNAMIISSFAPGLPIGKFGKLKRFKAEISFEAFIRKKGSSLDFCKLYEKNISCVTPSHHSLAR